MDERKYYTLSVCNCLMCSPDEKKIEDALAKAGIFTGSDGVKEVSHVPKTEEVINEKLKVGDKVHHLLNAIDMIVFDVGKAIGCRMWSESSTQFQSAYFVREELIKQCE